MTDRQNPLLARNLVNRTWGYFFGAALIEPVDDLSGQVKASHPELLDELAQAFTDGGFDLKFLLRVITLSRTYQLTSALPEGQENPDDLRLFSRMTPRLLAAEQLYDSLLVATGLPDRPSHRAEFISRFGRPHHPAESQRSILQALQLMNGKFIADATDLTQTAMLSAIADAPFLDTAGRVDALFLTTLSRLPNSRERERFVAYVEGGGPRKDQRRALADVFWALLNSNEFGTNH